MSVCQQVQRCNTLQTINESWENFNNKSFVNYKYKKMSKQKETNNPPLKTLIDSVDLHQRTKDCKGPRLYVFDTIRQNHDCFYTHQTVYNMKNLQKCKKEEEYISSSQEWGYLMVHLDNRCHLWEPRAVFPRHDAAYHCIFEVNPWDAHSLTETKWSQLEGKHRMVSLTDAEVMKSEIREFLFFAAAVQFLCGVL